MSDFTPRANLRLPGGGSTGTILPDEQVDIDVLNDNFRKIDALLGARNIPSASSYSGSMDGDLIFAQDTEYLHMYSASAAALITPRLPGSKMFYGTRAEREAFVTARDGDMWREDTGIEYVFSAGSPGSWKAAGNIAYGTKAARVAITNPVEGARWEDVDDTKLRYVARANVWMWEPGQLIKRTITSVATAANAIGLVTALTDVPVGQKLLILVERSPQSLAAQGVISHFFPYKLDGTSPIAAGPFASAAPVRHYSYGGGNVLTYSSRARFGVTAGGQFTVGLLSNGLTYGLEESSLAIYSE